MGKLRDKVAKGLFWVLMEKFGIQAVHFVVTLVLARLLTPNDYGTVALLSIFITISNVFVDCGFGKALVQKKTATQVDYNSVFYLSMAIAAVLYAVLFFASPWVADFYAIPELKIMLRILALSLIFHSINGVQNVELNRKMLFHLSFRISWVRAGVSAVVGIALAFMGYGPWALVWSSFFGGVAAVIARQCVIAWRPSLAFSWTSAKELFGFGWKMVVASLVDKIYSNLQTILIGKFYTRTDLAFVNKGRHIPAMVSTFISDSLRRVAFPALSTLQDDLPRLRSAMRRMIRVSTFFVFPTMALLSVTARPLVLLLFGEQWVGATPYLQITCYSLLMWQIEAVDRQGLMALGRSDVVLGLTVVRRILSLIVMACTLKLGVFVFFVAAAVTIGPIGFLISMIPKRRILGYTMTMQLTDVCGSFLLSLVAAVVALAMTVLPFNPYSMLPVQLALFCMVYLGLSVLFRVRPLGELAGSLLPMIRKKFQEGSIPLRFVSALSERCRKE